MVLAKSSALDKTEAINLFKGFLDAFQKCCNQSQTPSAHEFDKYLSRNFQITSNGKLLARNLTEYLNLIENFQTKFSKCEVSFDKADCICAENQVSAYFKINLVNQDGQKFHRYEMVQAIVEDHRFVSWKQVTHEKEI